MLPLLLVLLLELYILLSHVLRRLQQHRGCYTPYCSMLLLLPLGPSSLLLIQPALLLVRLQAFPRRVWAQWRGRGGVNVGGGLPHAQLASCWPPRPTYNARMLATLSHSLV